MAPVMDRTTAVINEALEERRVIIGQYLSLQKTRALLHRTSQEELCGRRQEEQGKGRRILVPSQRSFHYDSLRRQALHNILFTRRLIVTVIRLMHTELRSVFVSTASKPPSMSRVRHSGCDDDVPAEPRRRSQEGADNSSSFELPFCASWDGALGH